MDIQKKKNNNNEIKEKEYVLECISIGMDKWDFKSFSLNDILPLYIIDTYPDKNWDWNIISMHKDLSWDFIKKHHKINWNWALLSAHPCINIDIILDNPTIPWDWDEISFNTNLSWNIISQNLNKPWNWNALSLTLEVTIKIVLQFSSYPWSIKNLLENEFFMNDVLEKYDKRDHCFENYHLWSHFEKLVDSHRLWSTMSDKVCLKMEYIDAHPELPWNYHRLNYNPNITWNYVIENFDHDWDFNILQYNQNINHLRFHIPFFRNNAWIMSRDLNTQWHMIENNLHLELCWNSLSINPNINLDIVKRFLHLPWDFCGLSENINTKIDDILAPENTFLYTRWNWSRFSRNKNVTLDIVYKYPNLPWDYKSLSYNRNIATLYNLSKLNPYLPWDWSGISINLSFEITCNDKKEILKKDLKNIAFHRNLVLIQTMNPSKNLKKILIPNYEYYE